MSESRLLRRQLLRRADQVKDRTIKSIGSRLCKVFLALLLAQSGSIFADSIAARYKEGAEHGFLVLRTMEGKIVAGGDLVQLTRGNRVTSRLVFHFKDGSVDDETSVFTQNGCFRLISDHHIQKGPTFKEPVDILINTTKDQVTVRFSKDAEQKSGVEHISLPPDLVNGMILNVLKNIPSNTTKTTVSYLVAAPKLRIVKLAIAAQGEEGFSIAGIRHEATRFVVKVELGGLAGILAPLIGKQPADTSVWVVQGGAPAFVRSEGPLFLGGPIWKLEMLSPVWDRNSVSVSAPNKSNEKSSR